MSHTPVVLTIPARSDHLDIVRAALYAVASKAGFSFEEIEDMKVAVTEACTNAILHAYRGFAEGVVQLSFLWDQRELHISVKDFGSSFEHKEEARGPLPVMGETPLSELAVGGLGIFMMQALMDDVLVRTENGTEVVLIKRMSRNEEMV
ncbi:ATP-binding protein [Paenibacillus sp. GCM10027627]|uniref:ATP-binding protein n=1 Tax=unclassified Paenibacillus TaxID=185978 RepID=UPI00363A0A54